MYTKAPRFCSRQTAMGRPPKRRSKAVAQTSTASGVLSNSPCSACWESAGTSRQKCFWSAQLMAANAAHSRSVVTDGNESDMVLILQLERAGRRLVSTRLQSVHGPHRADARRLGPLGAGGRLLLRGFRSEERRVGK